MLLFGKETQQRRNEEVREHEESEKKGIGKEMRREKMVGWGKERGLAGRLESADAERLLYCCYLILPSSSDIRRFHHLPGASITSSRLYPPPTETLEAPSGSWGVH